MSEDKRSNKISNDYGAEQIQVLEGLEPVRKRPGMYIGSTGPRGLHHLVYEVVDNSVDEALAGHCDHIEIVLREDGSALVSDNGRGIPTDIHPRTGKSALETVLTVLHAGGKFGSGGYKVSGGLHGVGISVVNALSEWVNVTVYRDGSEFNQRFEKGLSKGELQSKKQSIKPFKTGTTICFKPDKTIFSGGIEFEYSLLSSRLRELAYLNGGVKIVFRDERNELLDGSFKEEIYLYEGGIKEYVQYMNAEKDSIHPDIIYVATYDSYWGDKNIWRTDDGGVTFVNITPTFPGIQEDNWIPYDITISDNDPLNVWIARCPNNTSYDSYESSKVYNSTNGGESWMNMTGSGLNGENITNIEYHRGSDNGIYLGTRTGVYYKNSSMNSWLSLNSVKRS